MLRSTVKLPKTHDIDIDYFISLNTYFPNHAYNKNQITIYKIWSKKIKKGLHYPRTQKRLKTNLLLLDRFKDLNDTFLIISTMNTLKDLAVFASPNLPYHFIIILFTAILQNQTNWAINQSNQQIELQNFKKEKTDPHWTVSAS